jgi:hypothetical protein
LLRKNITWELIAPLLAAGQLIKNSFQANDCHDPAELFEGASQALKKYLSGPECHRLFPKDEEDGHQAVLSLPTARDRPYLK